MRRRTTTGHRRLYRLQIFQYMSIANFTLAIFALLYAATNIVLIILNFGSHNDDDCNDPDDSTLI